MTARAGRNVTALRNPKVTVAAADAFLSTPRFTNANTHRAYAGAIDRTIALLGRERPLADITDAKVGDALTELWGSCARPPHQDRGCGRAGRRPPW
ncbi:MULTISPECIES: hypothetical protein [unclassified Nonomuraea]|uniref:hypothetical protein n=1 Tax=unclassified Nonomuraea TaxID=2593643 RepID=UPI00191BD129|nr:MULTISPECIES: hypothetical protein [unclassified Nonomuraea]